MFPKKLKEGDLVKIIAPSRSMYNFSKILKEEAEKKFLELGLKLSFSKHVEEKGDFYSSSISSRIQDLHDAFLDKNVSAVMAFGGGYSANQLLNYIDFDIIKQNPKIFMGFSDITILSNAIFAKTGLVTYSSPNFTSFAQKLHFEYTLNYFKKCLISEESYNIYPSEFWSDDKWKINQDNRKLIKNSGIKIIEKGNAKGTIIGGNLCTFNLLQGTNFIPNIEDSILFIEDDSMAKKYCDVEFDRNLQSLLHQNILRNIKAVIIGRFQKASKMNLSKIKKIIKSKKELENILVLSELDFGHSDPKITFPIGGEIFINASKNEIDIKILKH
ncbi:MAG: peptidase S66 [Chlamydiae bacterium RIFCSPHIGHO2_12_FULL_27_8]|nr:MAG: peptidase S66 [Chlamydiae bacterium RIFCSPHIGHO2_12_FULL_27_8]